MSLSPIIFYSKYSPFCERFFSSLEYGEINLKDIYKIEAICIDNTELRRKLLEYKKIEIRYTPTMLIFLGNGQVEKYEGEYCIQWAVNEIKKINPSAFEKKVPKGILKNKSGDIRSREEMSKKVRKPMKNKTVKNKPVKKIQKPKKVVISEEIEEEPDDEVESVDNEEENDTPSNEGFSSISDLQDLSEIDNEEIEGEDTEGENMEGEDIENGDVPPGNVDVTEMKGRNGKVNVSAVMALAQAMESKREKIEKRPIGGNRPPAGGRRM